MRNDPQKAWDIAVDVGLLKKAVTSSNAAGRAHHIRHIYLREVAVKRPNGERVVSPGFVTRANQYPALRLSLQVASLVSSVKKVFRVSKLTGQSHRKVL